MDFSNFWRSSTWRHITAALLLGFSACTMPRPQEAVEGPAGISSPSTEGRASEASSHRSPTPRQRIVQEDHDTEEPRISSLREEAQITMNIQSESPISGRLGGTMNGLAVYDGRAYTAVGGTLIEFGRDSGDEIQIRSRTPSLSGNIFPMHVVVAGDHAYLAAATFQELPPAHVEATDGVPIPTIYLLQFDLRGDQPRYVGTILDDLWADEWNSVRTMETNGSWIVLGVGGDLLLLDASNPQQVQHVDTIDDAGYAPHVFLGPDFLQISKSGLKTFDLSDPRNPIETSKVLKEDAPYSTVTVGPHLYALTCFMERKLWVLDNKNPLEPHYPQLVLQGKKKIVDCSDGELVLNADRSRLWIAGDGEVQLFDISDPGTPREIGRGLALTGEEGLSAEMLGERLTVVDGFGFGLSEYWLDEETGSIQSRSIALAPHTITSLAPLSPGALSRAGVSQDSQHRGSDQSSDQDADSEGNPQAILALGPDALWVLDPDEPESAKPIAGLSLWSEPATFLDLPEDLPWGRRSAWMTMSTRVRSSGDLAFIQIGAGMRIIDLETPHSPRSRGFFQDLDIVDIAPHGDRAFIASGSGLKSVDIRDPDHPKLLHTLRDYSSRPDSMPAPAILVESDRLHVLTLRTSGDNFLSTFDIGPIDAPLDQPELLRDLLLSDLLTKYRNTYALTHEALYIGNQRLLLHIDLDDLDQEIPQRISPSDELGFAEINWISGAGEGRILVNDVSGLQLLDLNTSPLTPERKWLTRLMPWAEIADRAVIQQDRAYIPGWITGAVRIDFD